MVEGGWCSVLTWFSFGKIFFYFDKHAHYRTRQVSVYLTKMGVGVLASPSPILIGCFLNYFVLSWSRTCSPPTNIIPPPPFIYVIMLLFSPPLWELVGSAFLLCGISCWSQYAVWDCGNVLPHEWYICMTQLDTVPMYRSHVFFNTAFLQKQHWLQN